MSNRLLAAAGLLLALALSLSQPAQAQVPLLDIRVGAHAAMPSGDFADVMDAGFGAYARVGVPLGFFKLMGSATYTQFKAAIPLIDDQNIFTLQAGPHFSPIPLLDLGLEGAYFKSSVSGEKAKFGLAPNVSVGLLMFEVTGSYYTTMDDPKLTYMTLGVGFRF